MRPLTSPDPALTVPRAGAADLKAAIAVHLEDARRRTLTLLEPLDDAELTKQHSPLMSPLVWDLAHIGHFEELWLLRELGGELPSRAEHDDLYDAFRHARAERGELPILDPPAARAYVADVRGRVLDVLDRIELDPANRLLADGFVFGLVIQHEQQHCETMLATLQLREGEPYPSRPDPPARVEAAGEARLEGGLSEIGTDAAPWAYDNERPAHEVELAPFRMDAAPVTNAQYLEFVEADGYADRRWWSEDGWRWREEEGAEHPQFWRRDAGWSRVRFGHVEHLPSDEPVQHVCWHEAEAFARWAGKRLPTEQEWEAAAAAGALNGVGAVWEWTVSHFLPYPGFAAFPYAEYSEVFFGEEYRVLRGASWATHPVVARRTFRNWDLPIRRQIFAGFRCAEST
jgi:gamma-glutamyl hercynylcysteine S-oxide synthase